MAAFELSKLTLLVCSPPYHNDENRWGNARTRLAARIPLRFLFGLILTLGPCFPEEQVRKKEQPWWW